MPRSIILKVIYRGGETYLTAADWRRICLLEITEGTEKKVNHYITFYMYNPILQISLSIAVEALRQHNCA